MTRQLFPLLQGKNKGFSGSKSIFTWIVTAEKYDPSPIPPDFLTTRHLFPLIFR